MGIPIRRRVMAMVGAIGLLLLVGEPALAFGEPHPSHGGPASYILSVSGTLAGGAQVKTTVKNSLYLGLAVWPDDGSQATPVGLVPLGHVDPGTHSIAWDLRVGGQLLAPGRYEVPLEVFSPDGHPSGRPFPNTAFVTISLDGHTSAVNFLVTQLAHRKGPR